MSSSSDHKMAEQSLDPSAWAIFLSQENSRLRTEDIIALRSTCKVLQEMASPLINKLKIIAYQGHVVHLRPESFTPPSASSLLNHVRNLEIVGKEQDSLAFSAVLGRCATQLEALDISDGDLLTDLLMGDEYDKPRLTFPNLKSLYLDSYGEYTATFALESLETMAQLEYLSLDDGLSTDGVKAFAKADFICNLKTLCLGRPDDRYWRGYSEHDGQPEEDIMEAINTILKRATKLETLTVRGQRSVAFFTDSNTTNLTDVLIIGCQIVEEFTLPSSVLRLEIRNSVFEYPVAVDLFTSGKSFSQVQDVLVDRCEFESWNYDEEEVPDWKKIVKRLQMPAVERISFSGYTAEKVVGIARPSANIPRLRELFGEGEGVSSEDMPDTSEEEDFYSDYSDSEEE